jgi:hypothetical protein
MTRKSDADGIRAKSLHAGPPRFQMKLKDAEYITMSQSWLERSDVPRGSRSAELSAIP